MALSAIECPFSPQQMVLVLTLASEDESIGISVMESLTPSERIAIFKACDWFRDHRDWDRTSYRSESD